MNSPRRSNLRFTALRLERWRNFSRININLAKRAFFVGPNASGKSNLLDVFRFLRDIVSVGGGFQEAVLSRGGIKSLRSLSARKPSDIFLEFQIGNDEIIDLWNYKLRFRYDTRLHIPLINSEIVENCGKRVLTRPEPNDENDPQRLSQTYLEQINSNLAFRELAEFFSTIRYTHIVPQLIREPDRSVGRSHDPFGGDFLEQMAKTNERTRNARLKKIRDALKVAIPQLLELELWRDAAGVPHLRGKYEHWRPQGAWQTEESFSDGTLRLLGLLWSLLEGGGPLLLEEPELSLHASVAQYIPQMFARMQRKGGRQVLVSTHAEALLNDPGLGGHEVHLLIPEKEGTVVEPATNFEDVRNLLSAGLPLGEIVLPKTKPKDANQLALFET